MGPIGCPETLVPNYKYANIREERKSNVHHDASLKSRVVSHFFNKQATKGSISIHFPYRYNEVGRSGVEGVDRPRVPPNVP